MATTIRQGFLRDRGWGAGGYIHLCLLQGFPDTKLETDVHAGL